MDMNKELWDTLVVSTRGQLSGGGVLSLLGCVGRSEFAHKCPNRVSTLLDL